MQELESTIYEARDTDKRLMNWWGFILLSFITSGIFYFVVLYQRIERRDEHFRRMTSFFRATLENTKDASNGTAVDISEQTKKIDEKLTEAEQSLLRPKNAILWVAVSILTMGLALFYVYYFLLVDWYRVQQLEHELLDDFNDIWLKLGMTADPVNVNIVLPDRNYWLYLFLGIITLGIWVFYWDYVTHTEPEPVFDENSNWESKILSIFKEIKAKEAA